MLRPENLTHLSEQIHKLRAEKEKVPHNSFDGLAMHAADTVLTYLHNALWHALDENAVMNDDCWLPVKDAPQHCVEGKPYTVRLKGGNEYDDCIYYNGKFFPEINGRCVNFERQPEYFALT